MDDVIAMFRALGDPSRARIFEFLCGRSGPVALSECGEVRPLRGVTVGEVCCHVTGSERANSTISFHLKELRLAGLITTQRNGKFIACAVRPEAIQAMQRYLTTVQTRQEILS